MGDVTWFVALLVLAVGTTLTLLCLAVIGALSKVDAPQLRPLQRPLPWPRQPRPSQPGRSQPRPQQSRLHYQPQGRRLRLLSRVLFASRSTDAITLDCTLVRAEEGLDLPPNLAPPVGLPFTLQLRPPETDWFAGRVEDLLRAWAEENRELVLELREDRGRVRTTIASGDSSVYLELAGAAGLVQS